MKYVASVTIVDDNGEAVYERELTQEQIIEELLRKPDPVTDEELDAALEEVPQQEPAKKAKLEKGDRVQYSAKGLQQLGERKGMRHGEVIGWSRDGKSVRVIIDDTKSPYNFHPSFWEIEGETSPVPEQASHGDKGKPCCGSKGPRHKKGCANAGTQASKSEKTFAKGTQEGKVLDSADLAWQKFKPKLSAMQFSEIKDMQMNEMTSVQIHSELDLAPENIRDVNFVMQSKTYEAYRALARRAEFA